MNEVPNFTIVLAGNAKQYEQYLRSPHSVGKRNVHGSSVERIKGLLADEVIIIGTFWDLKNAHQLEHEAQLRVRKRQ